MTITIDIMDNSNNSSGNDGGESPSKKRDMFMKRNSLFATDDLMFDPSMLEDEEEGYGDSLKDIFDDDGGLPGALSPNMLMPPPAAKNSTSDRSSTSLSSSGPLSSMLRGGAGGGPAPGGSDASGASQQRGQMDSADKSLSSSTWHSESADLAHRQAMIRDIAQLLFARKKDNPSKKWLQRLPLKARMLENQLYKSAASLDAYLDRSTLKRRLGSLASAITSHYKRAMQDKKRRNSATMKGGTSSLQSSIASFTNSSNNNMSSSGSTSSLNSNLPKLRREASESAVKHSKASFPLNAQNLRRQQSEPAGGMSLGQNLSLPTGGANSLQGGTVPTNLLQQQRNNAAINSSMNNSNNMGNFDMSSLAQQQAANEQLQNQILENIRQQREIVRRISGTDAANSMGRDVSSFMGNGMSLLNAGNNAMNNNSNISGNGMMNNSLNQLQQQNAFNQLQQQQQQMAGFGMNNNPLAALQQSNQQQSGTNNMNMNALLMGNAGGVNNMNMMNNFGLPNVVPGNGSFSSLQQMGNAGGNMNMPPPSAMNNSGSTDDPSSLSPMSPNSFHW